MPIRPGQYVVGGDLGGTRFRAALVDHAGTIVERSATLTHADEGKDAVLSRIHEHIAAVIRPVGAERVVGVGVAAPGPLDPWEGVIYDAPNLPGWDRVPLRDIVAKATGLPCLIGNDCNLAALAENRYGAAVGARSLVYITVSTGVGGGMIDHGRLILGQRGLAGEIGHTTLELDGPECGCGNRGCLEALAAGPYIAKAAVARVRAGEPSRISELAGGDLDAVTGAHVIAAAQGGDRVAAEVVARAANYLGIGVANAVNLFNPEVVVIGGGVANAGEILFGPIREQVSRRAMHPMRAGLRIERAQLGDDVGVLGAAVLAMDELATAG